MECVSAFIDREALLFNIKKIKEKAKDKNGNQPKVVAVVKANAYGHGLYAVANALKDSVDAYAVARIGEAMELRREGITRPVILLEGFFNEEDVNFISKYSLITAVNSIYQVEALEKAKLNKKIKVFLQVDIGMHRLGSCSVEEIRALLKRLENCPNVEQPVGMISHLSVADTPSETEYNRQQIEFFYEVSKEFKGELCLANSAGIFIWPETHTPWVRPGIVMYGVSPFEDKTGPDLGLKPVMTLKSRIIAIHKLKKGDKVGYGAAFVADRDTTLGVVSCGYGDGYPRCAPNGTPVLVNGREVPTAGHVCMDMLFVDLGPDSKDKVFDEVILWGKGLPVERIASLCNTIPYELLCHVMPRVEYVFG
ncbi:MAG: alanine racemase [Succinivibrio sp.]|jgi:alanine racemase|nr:alanine racemase [Succinivibrio sp.]